MTADDPSWYLQIMVLFCQATKEQACLRLFLDYHGLSLIWSWMVDIPSTSKSNLHLKTEILEILRLLPIQNKTILKDSKVLPIVERWAVEIATAAAAEEKTDKENLDSKESVDIQDTTDPESKDMAEGKDKDVPKDKDEEGSSSGSRTPVVSKDAPEFPILTTPVTTATDSPHDVIPSKKRRLLQRLQEEGATSSDEAMSENGSSKGIKVKMDPGTVVKEDADSQQGESCNELDTGAPEGAKTLDLDISQTEIKVETGRINDLASELLGNWADLKVRTSCTYCTSWINVILCLFF